MDSDTQYRGGIPYEHQTSRDSLDIHDNARQNPVTITDAPMNNTNEVLIDENTSKEQLIRLIRNLENTIAEQEDRMSCLRAEVKYRSITDKNQQLQRENAALRRGQADESIMKEREGEGKRPLSTRFTC